MLDDDDVEAAVGAGVLTQAQADALRTFARERAKSSVAERADEERFRFMRGFNDVFFAIGVALFGGGIAIYATMARSVLVYIVAAGAMWALAELLVRRRRLVLPGIVIVLFFAGFVAAAIPADLGGVGSEIPSRANRLAVLLGTTEIIPFAIKLLCVALAASIFYLRFRFPFALLPAAAGSVAAFALAIGVYVSDTHLVITATLLVCGIAVFVAAMRFDLSDRQRVTLRSDNAFWLHVLAAPLLVHSLIELVAGDDINAVSSLSISVVALLIAVVALIIDRRALLVSALVYVGTVIGETLLRTSSDQALVLVATLIILGGLVLTLGIAWAPLRRRIVSTLSPTLSNRLPPVATS
jgi:hypothetical protein